MSTARQRGAKSRPGDARAPTQKSFFLPDDVEIVHDALSFCGHVVDARDVQQFGHVARLQVRIHSKHAKLVFGHARVRTGSVQLVVRRMDSADVCRSIRTADN